MKEKLSKDRAEHDLDRRMRMNPARGALAVDEFGFRLYERESATAFFKPVSGRYERASAILTSKEVLGE